MTTLDAVIRAQRAALAAMDADARRRMREAYGRALRRVEADLDDAVRALEVFPGSEWRQYRVERLRSLSAQVEAAYAQFADDAARILYDAEMRAVSGGAQTAQEMAAAAGISGPVMGVVVNTQAMERLVASFAEGSPVRKVLQSYGEHGRQVIERELEAALAGGTSPREASRAIRRELGGRAMKSRIDALTRNELMRSFRGSLQESYKVLGVTRVRWSASLSSRTCAACLGRHGRTYPVDFVMDSHVSCRCILTPVPANDTAALQETGDEWLRRQSVTTQRRVIHNPDVYDLWQAGDITLSDFVGHRRSRVWGPSIRVKSSRELLGGRT